MAKCKRNISSSLRLIRSEPSQFASNFSELFCKIIPNIYDIKSQKFLGDVKKELKNIRRLKYFINNMDEKHSLVDIKFEEIAARCAYVYSYSVVNTSSVYREFSKHLESKENEFSNLFCSETLKICCLGGGPAMEAVGIIQSIHDIIWKSKNSNCTVNVYITVVDIHDWIGEISEIVKALNDSNLFPSKKINFHATFFKADLLKPFEGTLKEIINNADIVTIVNFIGAINEVTPLDCIPKIEKMMKSVIECMSDWSCLFMLDGAGGSTFYRAASITNRYRNVFDLQILKHKGYRLHQKTLKKLESTMNFRNFSENPTLFPTHLRKVSSCIWIRKPVPLKQKKKERKV